MGGLLCVSCTYDAFLIVLSLLVGIVTENCIALGHRHSLKNTARCITGSYNTINYNCIEVVFGYSKEIEKQVVNRFSPPRSYLIGGPNAPVRL